MLSNFIVIWNNSNPTKKDPSKTDLFLARREQFVAGRRSLFLLGATATFFFVSCRKVKIKYILFSFKQHKTFFQLSIHKVRYIIMKSYLYRTIGNSVFLMFHFLWNLKQIYMFKSSEVFKLFLASFIKFLFG